MEKLSARLQLNLLSWAIRLLNLVVDVRDVYDFADGLSLSYLFCERIDCRCEPIQGLTYIYKCETYIIGNLIQV